jgi:hypothetical protein
MQMALSIAGVMIIAARFKNFPVFGDFLWIEEQITETLKLFCASE